MDRRRGSRVSPVELEAERARKRRKQTGSAAPANGTEDALASAWEMFNNVWNYQERNRFYREAFEVLPDKDAYPDYYVKITEPISLHEIKAKLDTKKYASFDQVKQDLMLMCDNATTYNKTKSTIYSDAQQLKAIVESFVPSQANGRRRDETRQPKAAPTPARNVSKAARGSIVGLEKLQEAQMLIHDELYNLVDERGIEVSEHLRVPVSKKDYPDYYTLIKEPVALSTIKSRIKQGKYPTWADFERDVRLITRNVETFNALDSAIVADARSFEQHFLVRLREEKAKVPDATAPETEPAPPPKSGIKLRLNVGGKGGGKNHSTPQASSRNSQPPPVPATAPPKINLKLRNRPPSAPRSATPASAASPVLTPASELAKPVQKPAQKTAQKPAQKPASPSKFVKANSNISQANSSGALLDILPTSNGKVTRAAETQASPPRQAPVLAAPQPAGSTTKKPIPPSAANPPQNLGVNGTHTSTTEASITVRPKMEMPHTPVIKMSPPTAPNTMPPPPQRSSHTPAAATPRPASYSPAPPLNVSPQPATPLPVPEFTRSRPAYSYSEPTQRAEGMDASTAYMTNLRVTSSTASSDYSQDLKPDDRYVTVQYTLHPPHEHSIITLVPTLSQEILARPYNLTVHHKVPNLQPKLIQMSAARQKKKEEPPFDVQLTPGVTNIVEVTVVTKTPESQKSGIGGWDMERFRLFFYVI